MPVADNYDVKDGSGGTFNSWADAKTQMVSDVGGVAPGKIVSLRGTPGYDKTENITIPTAAQHPTTAIYPLRYSSVTPNTKAVVAGYITNGAGSSLSMHFVDLALSSNRAADGVVSFLGSVPGFISVIRCSVTNPNANGYGMIGPGSSAPLYMFDSSISATNGVIYNGQTFVTASNCRFYCAGAAARASSATLHLVLTNCLVCCTTVGYGANTGGTVNALLRHCTLHDGFSASGSGAGNVITAHGGSLCFLVEITDCIVSNFGNVYAWTAGEMPIWTHDPARAIRSNYNLYANLKAAGKFYNGTLWDYDNLAAWQAATGCDANSITDNSITFASTDITNASFLKLSAVGTANNAGRHLGIGTDVDGTARTNYLVDIGAHQFTAASYDAAKTLTTAAPAGTWNAANLTVDKVVAPTTYGPGGALTGTAVAAAAAPATPAGLAATDPQTDGDLAVTITNAADYAAGTRIDVYNSADDAVLGAFPATAGGGTIGGLTNDTEYTIYAKASKNGAIDSAASDTATETPTKATTAPASPTLTVVPSAGQAILTVAGASAGTTNRVYVRAVDADWSATPEATISGNGSATVALDAGVYYAYVMSSDLAGNQALGDTDPLSFAVPAAVSGYDRTDFGTDFLADEADIIFAEFGQTVTYRRGSASVTLTAIMGNANTEYDLQTGVALAIGDSSWRMHADDLDFGAGCFEPKAHDQVVTAKGEIFDVVSPGNLDSERVLWRIPTKRVEMVTQ